MFSGIIEEVGMVKKRGKEKGIFVCEIAAEKIFDDIKVGDSIAVNGVCLTVEKIIDGTFRVSLSSQTIKETNLASLKAGDYVNLERALRMDQRIGGHILSGHIDFKTPLKYFYKQSHTGVMGFLIPQAFKKYVVDRGSIGVDGISLTVAEIKGSEVKIFVIPYTLDNTNLRYRKSGDILNIEVDITTKQIEKILQERRIYEEDIQHD